MLSSSQSLHSGRILLLDKTVFFQSLKGALLACLSFEVSHWLAWGSPVLLPSCCFQALCFTFGFQEVERVSMGFFYLPDVPSPPCICKLLFCIDFWESFAFITSKIVSCSIFTLLCHVLLSVKSTQYISNFRDCIVSSTISFFGVTSVSLTGYLICSFTVSTYCFTSFSSVIHPGVGLSGCSFLLRECSTFLVCQLLSILSSCPRHDEC